MKDSIGLSKITFMSISLTIKKPVLQISSNVFYATGYNNGGQHYGGNSDHHEIGYNFPSEGHAPPEAHFGEEPHHMEHHHVMEEDHHHSHHDDHPHVEHPPILNIPHPYVITSNEPMGPEDEHFSKEKNTQNIAHVPHVYPPIMIHEPYPQHGSEHHHEVNF